MYCIVEWTLKLLLGEATAFELENLLYKYIVAHAHPHTSSLNPGSGDVYNICAVTES